MPYGKIGINRCWCLFWKSTREIEWSSSGLVEPMPGARGKLVMLLEMNTPVNALQINRKWARTCPGLSANGRTINWSSDVNIDPNHNSLQFYIGCLDWPISAALFSLGRCLCYPRFPSVPGWGGLISSPIWEHVNFLSTKNIFTQTSPLSK